MNKKELLKNALKELSLIEEGVIHHHKGQITFFIMTAAQKDVLEYYLKKLAQDEEDEIPI